MRIGKKPSRFSKGELTDLAMSLARVKPLWGDDSGLDEGSAMDGGYICLLSTHNYLYRAEDLKLLLFLPRPKNSTNTEIVNRRDRQIYYAKRNVEAKELVQALCAPTSKIMDRFLKTPKSANLKYWEKKGKEAITDHVNEAEGAVGDGEGRDNNQGVGLAPGTQVWTSQRHIVLDDTSPRRRTDLERALREMGENIFDPPETSPDETSSAPTEDSDDN